MEWLPLDHRTFSGRDRLRLQDYLPHSVANARSGRQTRSYMDNRQRNQGGAWVFHYTWYGSYLFHDFERRRIEQVSAGKAFLCAFPSNTAYEKTPDTELGTMWFIIEGALAAEHCASVVAEADGHVFDVAPESPIIRSLIKLFQAAGDSRLQPAAAAGLSYAFILTLLQIQEGQLPDPVMEAQDFIRQHLADHSLDVASIAAHVGLSRHHFSRLFKQATGTSIAQYIIHRRMDKALNLILSQRYKIKEVAAQLGYTEPAYFNAVFKKYYGYPPGQLKTGF